MNKNELETDCQGPRNVIILQRTTVILVVSAVVLLFVAMALAFYFIPLRSKSTECGELSPATTMQPQDDRKPLAPIPSNHSNISLDAMLPTYDPFLGRLPESLVPEHYDIWIKVYMDEEEYDRAFTYTGRVSIVLRCDEETSIIKIHAWWLKVDFDSVVVRHRGNSDEVALQGVKFDETYQFLIIDTEEPLEPTEKYVIEMSYDGELTEYNLCGFYPSSHKYGKEARWVALTSFQPDCARKAFPCLDEPQLKATFNISITHRPTRKALSNMPEIRSTTTEDGSWNTTYFDITVPMSTYHISFALLDFPSLERETSTGIQFRVWAEPTRIHAAEYALEIGVQMLTYFENSFQIKHPIPKMDMIAAPTFISGGLENWALIVYRDDYMLYDPNQDSTDHMFDVATIVAHELAHMWFGNLVTLKWWNDLWLNEGFASFLEYPAVDFVHPEWKMENQLLLTDVMFSMREDESYDVIPKPIVREVGGWSGELWDMFDSRIYQKGASIIRSLRAFLDEQVIERGLKKYLRAHLYDNVVTDDLWHALTEADKKHGGTDVKKMMDCWLLQAGLPLVTVTRIDETTLKVEQSQFIKDRDGLWEKDFPKDQKWNIPLTYTHSGITDFNRPFRAWLLAEDEYITIEIDDLTEKDWVIFNVNQTGYFHVNYDTDNWNKLAKQLKDDFEVIPTQTRAALLNDAFVIAESGELDLVVGLQLTEYMYEETEFIVWETVEHYLPFIRTVLLRTDEFELFQNYWRNQITPLYESLGWNFTGSHMLDYKRRLKAIKNACSWGNKNCIEMATAVYRQWMSDQFSDSVPQDNSLMESLSCAVIRQGGLEEWMFAYENSDEMDNPEKLELFGLIAESAMSCSQNAWLLQGYLEMYDEMEKLFVASYYMREKSALGFSVAWKFMIERFDELFEKYGNSLYFHIWLFGPFLNSESDLKQLLDFGSRSTNMSDGAVTQFYRAVGRVKENIAWMDKNMASVREWLARVAPETRHQDAGPEYVDFDRLNGDSAKSGTKEKRRHGRSIYDSSNGHHERRFHRRQKV
ncbi:aminopeptidase N-like [Ptychodera flava]|uniref:aminopeptidase N-like n=1 Tax=Ptychodera flava TaxID=63121 RepID=UPI00396A63B8